MGYSGVLTSADRAVPLRAYARRSDALADALADTLADAAVDPCASACAFALANIRAHDRRAGRCAVGLAPP